MHSYGLLQEKIRIKTSKGKKHMRWCPGTPRWELSHNFSQYRNTDALYSPSKVLPTGEARLSFGVQGFPAGQIHSHTVSGWPASAIQTPAPQKQEIDIHKKSHTIWWNWYSMRPKASGMQEDSGQVEYSKGSKVISQETGKDRSWRQIFLRNVQSLTSQTCFVSTFWHN